MYAYLRIILINGLFCIDLNLNEDIIGEEKSLGSGFILICMRKNASPGKIPANHLGYRSFRVTSSWMISIIEPPEEKTKKESETYCMRWGTLFADNTHISYLYFALQAIIVTLPYPLPYLSFVATILSHFQSIYISPCPLQSISNFFSSQSLQKPQRFLFNPKTNNRPLPLISHAMSFC